MRPSPTPRPEGTARAVVRIALPAVLLLLPALAGAAEPVAVVGLGADPEARAEADRALRDALEDGGQVVLPAAEARRRLGLAADRAVHNCSGEPSCLTGLARSLDTELWITEVQPEWEALSVSVQRIRPDGPSAELGRWSRIPAAEIRGAVYGAAFRSLRGSGRGTLSVRAQPADAEIVVGDRPLGSGPVRRTPVDAGEVVVEARADGYLAWRRRVAVRPDRHVSVEAVLEADVAGLPLAGLVPPPAEAAGAAPEPTSPTAAPEPAPASEAPVASQPGGATRVAATRPAPEPAAAESAATPKAAPADAAGYARLTPADAAAAGTRTSAPPAAVDVKGGSPLGSPAVLGAFGGGAVAVAAAAFFGVQAQDTANRARAEEIQVSVHALNEEAMSQARTANILYAVGGAALGVGTFLLTADLLSR